MIAGGEFLCRNFKDKSSGKVYFSTDREGRATKMQRTIFSEVFYVMAMAGLAKVTDKNEYLVSAPKLIP